jgi:trimethylamine--corrinoid protein Co-methyltransferase
VELIVDEAYRVLETVGARLEHDEAIDRLAGAGASVADDRARVFLSRDLCEKCLSTVPKAFALFDRSGEHSIDVSGGNTHFVPGSAATFVHDYATGEIRRPVTRDVIEFVAMTGRLPALELQSTGIVPADVPDAVADRYRLLLALAYGEKPIVTGTFTKAAFETILAFLTTVRGGQDALAAKPLAVFDCCPTSPLAWSDLTCQALLDCARHHIPANVVPAPLIGATSPVTLKGTLVQHTAENLSGIVIHQTARAGSPLGYGGAATLFDMRAGTAPMSAVEAVMVDAATAQIGKSLGLPVHAYLGLSDAKVPDGQAGFETAQGALIAALAGVNIAAGAGLLNYVNCQSLEKLVIDNEICAHALRFARGIAFDDEDVPLDVISQCADEGVFLTSKHTRRYFRAEAHYPDPVIDRLSQGDWQERGGKTAVERAHDCVTEMRRSQPEPTLDATMLDELDARMTSDAAAAGMDKLPEWRRAASN